MSKFVNKIGAHKSIIAVVAGKTNAIIGKATMGIPNPRVPLTSPPPRTANIIIRIIVGSLYIEKLWRIIKICYTNVVYLLTSKAFLRDNMNNIIDFLQTRRSVTAKNMTNENFDDEDLNFIPRMNLSELH